MSHRLDRLVAGVIVANTGLLVWSVLGHSELADRLETLCLAFFVGEIVVRLRSYGWRPHVFLRQRWNVFDTGVTLLRVARLARIVHLGRHITHLRLVSVLTGRHA